MSDIQLSADRVYCSICGFFVNPNRHSERCRVVNEDFVRSMRLAAWIGDALHSLDVRYHLIKLSVPSVKLQIESQVFVTDVAQATFYVGAQSHKVPARGQSVSLLSEAFEASYSGSFRREYHKQILIDSACLQIPDSAGLLPPLLLETLSFNSVIDDVSSSVHGVGGVFTRLLARNANAHKLHSSGVSCEIDEPCFVGCPHPACSYEAPFLEKFSTLRFHISVEHPIWLGGYGRSGSWLLDWLRGASCDALHAEAKEEFDPD